MSRLAWPCAHCGGAFHEPLTMAAKRHRNSPRAVLEAFRALERPGGPERRAGRGRGSQTGVRATAGERAGPRSPSRPGQSISSTTA